MADTRTSTPARAGSVEGLQKRYDDFRARGLKLDMTRGKPSSEQLNLSSDLLTILGPNDYTSVDGTDTRNYGGLDGLPEMKAIFAELFDTGPASVIVGGASSLTMMHDAIVRALLHGVPDGKGPWNREGRIKFLCPSPGYDRHFAITEHFGFELVTIEMGDEGPDVEAVSRLVAADASIKGMWCVPKYSNPTGATCSGDVVRALAAMKTAAPDFRLFWDNAYAVHDLYDTPDALANVLTAASDAGHPNRPLVFGSTSKISFAGAGVAAMAASPANVADTKKHLGLQTIGPDKVNQLRHVRFFRNLDGIHAHMKKHAALLRPKFDAVGRVFAEEFAGSAAATWTKPRGGYFVSVDVPDGCAAEVVRLAEQAGVKFTGAGATFPYGKDPRDRNIRVAPSLPPLDQVELAMRVFAVAAQLASAKALAAPPRT